MARSPAGLEDVALLPLDAADDLTLAFEVETALKALGIASDRDSRGADELRSAVETLKAKTVLRIPGPTRMPMLDPVPAFMPSDEDLGFRRA